MNVLIVTGDRLDSRSTLDEVESAYLAYVQAQSALTEDDLAGPDGAGEEDE